MKMEKLSQKNLKARMNFGLFLLKLLISIPLLTILTILGLPAAGIGYWMIRRASILTSWLFDLKPKKQLVSPPSMLIATMKLPPDYWKTYSPLNLN